MTDCANCGGDLRDGGNQAVMDRESTGFGLANEIVTWYCTRWCREADAGIPPAYRCLEQTRLDQFGDDEDGPGGIPSASVTEVRA